MPTNFTATTEMDFDTDVADISNGPDSAADTAYTVALANDITLNSDQTLTLPDGSSLAVDGPGTLTVAAGDVFDVTTASGAATLGVLTLDTPVSGDAYTQSAPAATIVLNGAGLVNGSSAALHAGANQLLSGTVLGQSASDSVDNFGQIEVPAATTSTAVFLEAGGTVTNESSGTLSGGTAGTVLGAAGTVTNAGAITGGQFGIYFSADGAVVNGPGGATTASIQGGQNGILIGGNGPGAGNGTVTNDGTITATTAQAVDITGDGTVTNGSSTDGAATIQTAASNAVEIDGATATVTNDATISSTDMAGAGVLIGGGTVNNGLNDSATALIQGGEDGVSVSGGSAAVTNLGTIKATDATGQAPGAAPVVGVSLTDGGTVYNGFTAGFAANGAAVTSGADDGVLVQGAAGSVINSGTISGTVAIDFDGVAGTVADNGAITSTAGAAGTAIQFGSGQSLLQLGSGFTITGKVEGGAGAGAATTLELVNGTGSFSGLAGGSGTVTNGFAFDSVGTIQIDSGAVWSFSGVDALAALQVTGEADIAANGSLEITGTATGTGTIGQGTDSALVIDTAAGFGTGQSTASYTGDVIAQFAVGDSIDLKDVAFATLTTSFATNQLQLSDGTHTADLDFAPGFTALSNFNFATDATGGTVVTVACYCPGTLIATPGGEVAIEDLAIGDLVLTADGRAEPIRWIGRRSYTGRFVLANPKVQPVRFRAGSLGDGLPRRDLLVSPEHAMLLDGLLVPARCLVNGIGIVPERGRARVEYIHIELADHAVILAEGAASETFVDDDSRAMFENAGEFAELYPEAVPPAAFCAPRVEDGYELHDMRQRLAAAAATCFATAA